MQQQNDSKTTSLFEKNQKKIVNIQKINTRHCFNDFLQAHTDTNNFLFKEIQHLRIFSAKSERKKIFFCCEE